MKFTELQTPRLKIRMLVPSDLNDFHEYRSNPEVVKFQGFDVMTLEEAATFIYKNAKLPFQEAGEWVQYAIEHRETGKLIGDCALKLDASPAQQAEIGITISHKFQKQGFATETLEGLLQLLFAEKTLHRVVETVDAENIASVRLLERVGFRREGHFVENIFFKGKWGSEFQYAMLKREWDAMNHQ